MKKIIFFLALLFAFVLIISNISAEALYNLTTPVITADYGAAWQNLTCEQKLNETIGWYNSCAGIIQNGTNCGVVYTRLNQFNAQCKSDLALCKQDNGPYKTISFVLAGILFIIGIIWIILGSKRGKNN